MQCIGFMPGIGTIDAVIYEKKKKIYFILSDGESS